MRKIQPGSTTPAPYLLWKQTVSRRLRMMRGKDRTYEIGGTKLVLPPGHLLPEFQQFSPTYDTYATPLLETIAENFDGETRLIDVGANVGDTTLLALLAHPNITVTAVEGSGFFTPYLRRNIIGFANRVTIVEKFVGDKNTHVFYEHNGSTGGFTTLDTATEQVEETVTPEELYPADPRINVIWKTDTDGQDLNLLTNFWDTVKESETIWFEFDPGMSPNGTDSTRELAEKLKTDRRHLLIFDNFGRYMMTSDDPGVLNGLAGWLPKLEGSLLPSIKYCDVWAVKNAELAEKLTATAHAG